MSETNASQPKLLSASYGAWNRLLLISSGTQNICENVYAARGYSIREDPYTRGTLNERRYATRNCNTIAI